MQHDLPRQRGAAVSFTFETALENEGEVLDNLLGALARNQLPPVAWSNLHLAAVRDDRVAQLGEAYVAVAQGKRLRAAPPQVAAEFLYRAGLFFSDAANEPVRSIDFWHRALVAFPGHQAAFGRLESALVDAGHWRAQADLYVTQAHHRPRSEQADLLRRAVDLLEKQPGTGTLLIEHCQEILRLDPRDDATRGKLEARLLEANRPRDVARLLEQALVADPPPPEASLREVRGRLLHLYAGPLAELERSMPHVEALLADDPEHEEARAVAQRLLEVKALAGRAAAALAQATEATGTPADVVKILAVELEHTRGPKRRDVLRRLGLLRQDGTGDEAGAYEAFEQALALDPTDDEVLRRYVGLAVNLHKAVDAGRALARFGAAARDPHVRARLSAEVGELYLLGGDPKRARAAFVGVLAMPDLPESIALQVSRSLCGIYSSEHDFRSLADSLDRVAQLEPNADLRQTANEELATLAQATLRDVARAIVAWRRLVDTPARARALAALEPLYEATANTAELAFVLEERSKDEPDDRAARSLAFRAAQVLTSITGEKARASEAWARYHERFGADREALAAWIPLLEADGDWTRLCLALEGEASLAPEEERPSLFAKIGQIRLQRTDDVAGAIRAFGQALASDPTEKTSRATLEQLAAKGPEKLAAARVLEPHYRRDQNAAGLLRSLDLTATLSSSVGERVTAIEEALALLAGTDSTSIAEWVARGLREAVAVRGDVGRWVDRLEATLGRAGRRRTASILTQAIGDLVIDSPPLLLLAQRAAEAHVASGDGVAGLSWYRRALAYDPASPDLLARVDDLLRELGASAERVTLYRTALDHTSDPQRRRELLHTIASIERTDLRDASAAIATYESAAAEDPTDVDATAALGELYAEAGHWGELLVLLERSLARASSENARAIRAQMAEIAIKQNDLTKAREHALAVLGDGDLAEREVVVLERVARALEDVSMLRAVLERRAALATDPVQQMGWLDRLGELELSCSEPDPALATWRRAAGIAESIGEVGEARRLYERIRSVAPNDRDAAHHLAELLEAAGEWARLPDLYAIMLEHSELPSERISVLMRQASLLATHLDDINGALVSAAQAFQLASESSEYREVLATFTTLALRGKATQVFAQAIDEAIERNLGPDEEQVVRRSELRMAKARVLAANREGRDAAVAAYRAILEDAGAGDAQLKPALHAFESLLSSEPADARRTERRWLFGWRAERATGRERAAALEDWASAEESVFSDPNQALDLYRRVLAIEPESVRALSAVARLSLGLGDPQGAVDALSAQRDRSEGATRRAIDLEIAATLLHRLGRPGDALTAISRLLDETPDDPGALALATQLLSDPSTRDAMAKVLEDAQNESQDPATRARILRALLDAAGEGGAPAEVRGRWFEALLEIQRASDEPDLAFQTVLAAALEQPHVMTFWDHAEDLARKLQRPADVADAHRRALALPLSIETATLLGERGVAFQEEWFDDVDGVVRILERVLEVDPHADWAFNRLKMIFDSGERWVELFALYDRTILLVDDAQKATLYEDAAQIAKDFANDSDRAVGYLEKLLALRPSDSHLVASLERLYERKGAHRELVGLLTRQLDSQKADEAQRTRARIARIWLDDLKDPDRALDVAQEIQRHASRSADGRTGGGDDVDAVALIEQVMAHAPRGAAVQEGGPKPVRYRAASILREHYERERRDADLARLLEVELEIATNPRELAAGHRQIADHHAKMGDLPTALEHVAALVLLEPEASDHRVELAELAARVGRYDRLAAVLVEASEKADSETLRAELMTAAGDVWVGHLHDEDRAMEAYLGVLAAKAAPAALVLDAARKVEPLLEHASRAWDLLDVLERLAALEETPSARARAWMLAARLATSLGDRTRAITAWEARLSEEEDPDALDSLIDLLEQQERWSDLISALAWRAREPRSQEAKQADRVRIARIQQDRIGDPAAAITEWTATEAEFGPTDESTDALCLLLEKTERWSELEEKLGPAASRAQTDERRAEIQARLGDVLRTHRGDAERARVAYGAAMAANPREPVARAGLLAIARADLGQPDALQTLLAALAATDEWQETLALTSLRYDTAHGDAERTRILCESAKIAEDRCSDPVRAFELEAGAFVLAPERDDVTLELTRLATATGRWQQYAQAHADVLRAPAGAGERAATLGDPTWRARFRHRLGKVMEEHLGDAEGALRTFEEASSESPVDLTIALSTISTAARLARWETVAATLVRLSRGLGCASGEALSTAEAAAQAAHAWDDLARTLERELASTTDLPRETARDLEARIGAWHRDRRGDPDAAEAAFSRALAHDESNTELLTALAQLQRRAKGRPLVDSLLRLSVATGGDLELLREAAEVTITELSDRGLAKSILGSLIALVEERWKGRPQPGTDLPVPGEHEVPVSVGSTAAPAPIVRWAIAELARIHDSEGHPELTVDLLSTTARLPWEASEARRMLHDAARIARETVHDTDRAIHLYEGLVETDPDDRAATSALIELYDGHQRHAELLRLHERIVLRTTDALERVPIRLSSARIESALGHGEAAVALLRANLVDAPRDADTVAALVAIFETTGRFDDLAALDASQAQLAESAGDAPVGVGWWIRAAEASELRLSDAERAIQCYRRALALEEHPGALDAVARLLSARGQHAAAAETLERLVAVARAEARPSLVLRLVDTLVAVGDLTRARQRLEEACAATPDDELLGNRLVAMYEEQGAWDALAELHRARAARAPDRAGKLTHLRAAADLFIHRSRTPDAAIPLLEEASVLDPDDRTTKVALANAFVRATRFVEARSLLRAIIDGFAGRRPRERGVVHYHLALLEIAMDNRAQALTELDAATKIDPSNAQILRALAELARQDGQIDRAVRSYRALLVVLKRPEDSTEDSPIVKSEVLLELSAIATDQGETDRAHELIESALESASKSAVEGRRLEQGLREKKDFPTLVRALEARIARATSDAERVEALTELARVLDVELGHVAAAFAARQKVLALTPASAGAHEACLSLARRVDGVARYLEDVEQLAAEAEREGRRETASTLYLLSAKAIEGELSDDARALAAYEKSLALATADSPTADASRPRAVSPQALAAIRALDPVYARLGKTDERARLLAKRVELESTRDDPKSAADARYRLAELVLATPEGAVEGGLLVTQALALDHDLARAEHVVQDAARLHPTDGGLIDLLEQIGRNAGHEDALLEALELRSQLPGASPDVVREASALARQLGHQARAEALLTKYVERGGDEDLGWAFEELAAAREAAGDVPGAIGWKKRAADVTGAGEARRLRFEVARLTETALGDLAGAAAMYEALFEDDPSDAAASEPMLAAYRKLGDAAHLVDLLPRAVEHATTEEDRTRLRFERVRLLVDPLGRRDEAIDPLAELVTDEPNFPEAASLLADLYEKSGRKDDLRDLLGRQIDAAKDRQDSKLVEALCLRRAALIEADDPDEARATLFSALDWTPESRPVLEQLVRLLQQAGLERERLDARERLLALASADEAEHDALELAELRTAEGNAEAAERALEIGYRRNPASRVLHDKLEAAYRSAEAHAKLAELVAIEAGGLPDPAARVARLREAAELFAKVGDVSRVASTLAEAFTHAKTDLKLATELAAAQIRAKDLPGASATLALAVELAKDDRRKQAELLLERANVRTDLGEDEAVVADLITVARLGVADVAHSLAMALERARARAEARGEMPLERSLRIELATLHAEVGEFDPARTLLTELLRREPRDRESIRLLARVEERAERWDAAAVAYRRLIPLEEGDLAIDTALRLADACEHAGRLADARGALESARTSAPHDEALRLRLVRLYEAIGAFRELGEMSLAEALEAPDEDSRFVLLKRAGACLMQDPAATGEAIHTLVNAHRLVPADVECTLLLADAYTLAGRTGEAHGLISIEITARAGKRSPELASLYHRLARVAHVAGDRAEEQRALTAGLEADGQNGFIAAELASMALEVGDMDAAIRALRCITLLKDPSTSNIPKGLAFQYLGEIAHRQGDAKRAILLLRRALDEDPSLDAAKALVGQLRAAGIP
jgi:tetratricopeptide (TPR) repeat protein